jgi:hypothetical protein
MERTGRLLAEQGKDPAEVAECGSDLLSEPYSDPYTDPYSDPHSDPYSDPYSDPSCRLRGPWYSRRGQRKSMRVRSISQRPSTFL